MQPRTESGKFRRLPAKAEAADATAGCDLIIGCLPEPFAHDDGLIAAGRSPESLCRPLKRAWADGNVREDPRLKPGATISSLVVWRNLRAR